MGLKNPQAQFEDGIFGPGGMHLTPATLPYPTQPLKTISGETVESFSLFSDGSNRRTGRRPQR